MDVKDLMIGNYIFHNDDLTVISNLDLGSKTYCIINDVQINKETFLSKNLQMKVFKGIPLTEEILLNNCKGFGLINENSAGKRYAYLENGVFSSDLTFIYWKTTKNKGKFFRRDLEIKYLHEIQNLLKILIKKELEINF